MSRQGLSFLHKRTCGCSPSSSPSFSPCWSAVPCAPQRLSRPNQVWFFSWIPGIWILELTPFFNLLILFIRFLLPSPPLQNQPTTIGGGQRGGHLPAQGQSRGGGSQNAAAAGNVMFGRNTPLKSADLQNAPNHFRRSSDVARQTSGITSTSERVNHWMNR